MWRPIYKTVSLLKMETFSLKCEVEFLKYSAFAIEHAIACVVSKSVFHCQIPAVVQLIHIGGGI